MSGDSETGGGGSVHWKVDANNVEQPNHAHHVHVGKKLDQDGRDKDGIVNTDHFTVSIKPPDGMSADAFRTQLGNDLGIDGGRVYFNLRIENDKKQIRISWGPGNPNVKP